MLDVDQPLAQVRAQAASLGEQGIFSLWCLQIFGFDALTLLGLIGQEAPGVELGTSVVPIFARHPVALAAQALTVQEATGGRLTLGVGLSHQVVVENVFGASYERPARAMREYLQVLVPLLHDEQVSFQGETLRTNTFGPLTVKALAPPVLVAALGTTMLRIAGRLADGTVTWMTGLHTVAEHIVPTIRQAALDSGRPAPRVAVGLPVCVTDDVARAREQADAVFRIYGALPSYRAMLDREQAGGPADVAVVGSETDVAATLERLAAAGATDFLGALFGSSEEKDRTGALLAALAREHRR
jgi:F420-dependent oxidoreductase-like protein